MLALLSYSAFTSLATDDLVIFAGLKAEPLLNGRLGVVLGSARMKKGRYNVRLLTEGAGLNVSAPRDRSIRAQNLLPFAEGVVDPRDLPRWPSFPPVRPVIGEEETALRWAFSQSQPQKIKLVGPSINAAITGHEGMLSSFGQWVHSMIHAIHQWETKRTWRVVLQLEHDATESITLDVLGPVLSAPDTVPRHTHKRVPEFSHEQRELIAKQLKAFDFGAASPGLGDALLSAMHMPEALLSAMQAPASPSEPLVSIRYLHSLKPYAKASRTTAHKRGLPESCPVAAEATAGFDGIGGSSALPGINGHVYVWAETAAEMAAALAYLQANERMLSASYREAFDARSAAHGGALGFRPSFLVPPLEPYTAPRKSELREPTAADAARPSVAVDLRLQEPRQGSRLSSHDLKSYAFEQKAGVAPRDVHLGKVFRLKVQPPQPRGAGGGCLTYDRERSFEAMLPCDPYGDVPYLKLMELIYTRGWGANGPNKVGGKGFFDAVREGPVLRVYTDLMLTDLDW